ncbi:MAG: DUF6062 family protein, partial [Chloroflexi bacterium]|nr:DUF6062 family protein [Chloroflexota bacterium]
AAELARSATGGRPDLFGAGHGHGGVRGRLAALAGRDASDNGGRVTDPHRACPACQERDRYELLYLEALLDHTPDERMAQAFADAGGLCMVHLDRLITTTRQSGALARLIALQRECLLRLHDELTEFIRKNDYRFSSEGMGVERDSWVRAVEIVAGKPGVR